MNDNLHLLIKVKEWIREEIRTNPDIREFIKEVVAEMDREGFFDHDHEEDEAIRKEVRSELGFKE